MQQNRKPFNKGIKIPSSIIKPDKSKEDRQKKANKRRNKKKRDNYYYEEDEAKD